MKKLYILKIGGSVATKKSTSRLIINKLALLNLAKEIKRWKKENSNINLILIHGAGGPSHHLAKKYNLTQGALHEKKRWQGSILSRIANQSLNLSVLKIFNQEKLPILPVHPGTAIIQKNKSIDNFFMEPILDSLKNDCIPLLYGEMVFDQELGMTICSGDTIAAYLAEKLNAKKVFFASDIDGVFNSDPHIDSSAKLISKINFKDIFSNKISVSSSHNQDVTGGLRGKLKAFKDIPRNKNLKEIIIFNGTNKNVCYNVLNNTQKILTKVYLKK